jgi:hypothetical protein
MREVGDFSKEKGVFMQEGRFRKIHLLAGTGGGLKALRRRGLQK